MRSPDGRDEILAATRRPPGAAVHLRGRGDFSNLFLIDIPPGKSTETQRHLYEEVVYVVEGRGSTQLEFEDGRTHSFEWQPCSMFAIPLNAKYRLHNGDGKNRAILGTVTSMPLMMKIFHNDSFIFENTHFFEDRIGKDTHYNGIRRSYDDPSRQQHLGDEFRPGFGVDRTARLERARRGIVQPHVHPG